jgi:signal transduction histidine kinase
MAIKQSRALKYSILLFFIWAQSIPGLAQVDNIRLIESSLPAIKDSVRYVDAINRLAMLLYEQNADSTAWYAYRAREIATRIDYKQGIADATDNLGVTADVKGNTQTALHYYNDAYLDYVALKDSSNMVQTLMNIALLYSTVNKTEKAIEHYERAFAIGNKLQHDSIVSLLIYNYLLKYPERFSRQSAAEALKRAVDIAARYHDTRMLLGLEQLKADELISDGKRELGIADLQQTAESAEQQGLLYMSLDILVELGDLFAKSDSARAVGYYRHALAITEQKKFGSYSQDISQRLFDFYSAKKDTALAFFYSRKLLAAVAEKQDNERKQGFDYLDFAVKDQDLAAARQRSDYNAKLFWLAAVLCAMAIAIIFILRRNGRQKAETHMLLQNQYSSLEAASESLEKTNQQYARVLKVVAHDLRNPIGAIHSAGNIMISANEFNPGMTKMIGEASGRCLEMINELLETDFEIKQESLKKTPVVVNHLIQPVIDLMQFRAKDKNQAIILKASSQTIVWMDKQRMTRVLDNLLVNAIKFSPEHSTITLSVSDTRDHLTISVRDEGMGIPSSIASQLFDPFTTAKRKGTAGEQTSGLGLYICKQIMEAHGGNIWFVSAEDKGSTFFVQLIK